jgi:hypothetical protein
MIQIGQLLNSSQRCYHLSKLACCGEVKFSMLIDVTETHSLQHKCCTSLHQSPEQLLEPPRLLFNRHWEPLSHGQCDWHVRMTACLPSIAAVKTARNLTSSHSVCLHCVKLRHRGNCTWSNMQFLRQVHIYYILYLILNVHYLRTDISLLQSLGADICVSVVKDTQALFFSSVSLKANEGMGICQLS